MAPMEVLSIIKAHSDSRRVDVIERGYMAGMFSGLAFAGKLETMDKYMPKHKTDHL